jgi:hypothetical protein
MNAGKVRDQDRQLSRMEAAVTFHAVHVGKRTSLQTTFHDLS